MNKWVQNSGLMSEAKYLQPESPSHRSTHALNIPEGKSSHGKSLDTGLMHKYSSWLITKVEKLIAGYVSGRKQKHFH